MKFHSVLFLEAFAILLLYAGHFLGLVRGSLRSHPTLDSIFYWLYRFKDLIVLFALTMSYGIPITLETLAIIFGFAISLHFLVMYTEHNTHMGHNWGLANGIAIGLLLPNMVRRL